MATHSSVLAWRIPGSGEPRGLLSIGSHRVGHEWSEQHAPFTFKPSQIISCRWIIWYLVKMQILTQWVCVGAWEPAFQQAPRWCQCCWSPGYIVHYESKERKEKEKLLSCVWLFATPWTIACQAPPSMEFSRQEYWSGLPFPSPGDLPDPGIQPRSPALQADASLPSEPPGKSWGSHCTYNSSGNHLGSSSIYPKSNPSHIPIATYKVQFAMISHLNNWNSLLTDLSVFILDPLWCIFWAKIVIIFNINEILVLLCSKPEKDSEFHWVRVKIPTKPYIFWFSIISLTTPSALFPHLLCPICGLLTVP